MSKKIRITIQTEIQATVKKVWKFWTQPEHIKKWNNASEDWHTPKAVNDLKVGGRFEYRMEAKDGSFGFDLGGNYTEIQNKKHIGYTLDDGRKVAINFHEDGETVLITETFESENQNPVEMQKQGWQSILDNFKKYVEKS